MLVLRCRMFPRLGQRQERCALTIGGRGLLIAANNVLTAVFSIDELVDAGIWRAPRSLNGSAGRFVLSAAIYQPPAWL
jgi:hypothetical protein